MEARSAAHYQTKPHPVRYSETRPNGSTLKLLWILRHSFMRRTLFIIFVLAALWVSPAYGLRKHTTKPHESTASAAASHKSTTASHNKARHAANHAVGHRAAHPAPHRQPSRSHQASKPHRAMNSHRHTEADAAERPAVAEAASLRKTPMPPPLRGSLESLVRQNDRTEDDNLERIQDDDDLADRIARGMLVPLPVSAALTVNEKLPENRRYCRPWTATFLTDLARAHAAAFHGPLEVSSAVRTVAYQKQLMKINGNATSAEGDIASPHLTGATIDIAKQGLSRQQISWMRAWLLSLEKAGMIDVEEEFHQSCFHITVYKSYVSPSPARKKATQATAGQVRAGSSGF